MPKPQSHSGRTVANKGAYRVIDCLPCGFKHLHPLPSAKELSEFYEKDYLPLIKQGGRAQEIRRQMEGGREAKAEIRWLKAALYKDIDWIASRHIPRSPVRRLLDIGSGTGEFLKFMNARGWRGMGIEPSRDAYRRSRREGLDVRPQSLEGFMAKNRRAPGAFDLVTLLNVLEHVPHPKDFLTAAKRLLKPGTGILCVRVPNDFNAFQAFAEKKSPRRLWWVAIPDHLNYFSVESLTALLNSIGLSTRYATADFPMELFLLMGENYIGNPDLGKACHQKRIRFELSLSPAFRRTLYQALSSLGIGRDLLLFAKND
jgi:2-polyprenyl-3-methyl-5-hydroxy-6-metoxy-1,4-benzoquinol methylase